jgi:hypothetical protein
VLKAEYVLFCAPTVLQIAIYRDILSHNRMQSVLRQGGSALEFISAIRKVTADPGMVLRLANEAQVDMPSPLFSSFLQKVGVLL